MRPTSDFPFPRRRLWRLYREWIARNRGRFVAVSLGVVGAMVLETVVLSAGSELGRLRAHLLGVTHAILLGAWLGMPFLVLLASKQEAVWQLRGRSARTTRATN